MLIAPRSGVFTSRGLTLRGLPPEPLVALGRRHLIIRGTKASAVQTIMSSKKMSNAPYLPAMYQKFHALLRPEPCKQLVVMRDGSCFGHRRLSRPDKSAHRLLPTRMNMVKVGIGGAFDGSCHSKCVGPCQEMTFWKQNRLAQSINPPRITAMTECNLIGKTL